MYDLKTILKAIGFMITGAVLFGLIALLFITPSTSPGPHPDSNWDREVVVKEKEKKKKEPAPYKVKMKVRFVKAEPRPEPKQAPRPKVQQVQKAKQPPRPKSARKPEKVKKAAAKPLDYQYQKQFSDKGKTLLGHDGQKIGSFPAIHIDTGKYLSSHDYIQAMQRIGGRFAIMDLNTDRLVAMIDLRARRLRSAGSVSGMSPKSRFISGESWIKEYTAQIQKKRGPGKYQVVLLLPMRVDHYIAGVIEDALGRSGIPAAKVASLSGWYRKKGGKVSMELRALHFKDGNSKPVNINLQLET